MRILAAPILGIVFVMWILYRALIKKDLKQHLNDLYVGLFFILIWAILFYLIV